MRSYLFALVMVVAGLALIAGCSQQSIAPDVTEDEQASLPADGVSVETGNLKLNTASIAPWVVTKKGGPVPSSAEPSSRAYLVGTSVDILLYDASSAFYDEVWLYPTTYFGTSYDWTDLPVGEYEVDVYVYNDYISSVDPVVYGWAYATVTAGGYADAVVTCEPYAYEWLYNDYWSYEYALPTSGGETWFEFSPATSSTTVACYTYSGDMDVYVFGPDGLYVDNSAVSGVGTEYLTIDTSGGIGYTWYVAMYAFEGGSGYVGYVDSGSPPTGAISITIQ